MFKRDKLHVAVDIVAIATEELARGRKEVVFYFLATILKNEERESRRKKVKDTPLSSEHISLVVPPTLALFFYCVFLEIKS